MSLQDEANKKYSHLGHALDVCANNTMDVTKEPVQISAMNHEDFAQQAQQSMVETSEEPIAGSLEWLATQLKGFKPGCNYVFWNDCGAHFTINRVVGSYSLAEIDEERVRQGLDPNDYRVKGDPVYQDKPAQQESESQEWEIGTQFDYYDPDIKLSYRGVVIGFYDGSIVGRMEDDYPHGVYDGFSPNNITIAPKEPTQAEQKAEEEREEFAARMSADFTNAGSLLSDFSGVHHFGLSLYDWLKSTGQLSQGKE